MSKFGLAFSGIFTCWSRRAIVDVSFLMFVCLNVVWRALFLHVSAVDHTNVFSLLKSGVTLEVLNECLFLNIISFCCLHRKLKKKNTLLLEVEEIFFLWLILVLVVAEDLLHFQKTDHKGKLDLLPSWDLTAEYVSARSANFLCESLIATRCMGTFQK